MSIANRAVDALFGPRVIQHETIASSEPAAATPAPNMTNVANSDDCGGQSKALSDVGIFFPFLHLLVLGFE